jgi:putative transposase
LGLAQCRCKVALAQQLRSQDVGCNEVAASIKDGLMACCCSAGLAVVARLMEEEMTAKVGPKGRHDPERIATRNGSARGSVVLGGRSVPVRRPRATRTSGGEVQLDSYALFSDRDLLTPP